MNSQHSKLLVNIHGDDKGSSVKILVILTEIYMVVNRKKIRLDLYSDWQEKSFESW